MDIYLSNNIENINKLNEEIEKGWQDMKTIFIINN